MVRTITMLAVLFLLTPPLTAAPRTTPWQELRTFVEAMEHIKREYVEPVDDETLIRNAIRGMLQGLDPHSAYLDEQDWGDVHTLTTGRYDGLGLEVVMEDGLLRVVAPIDSGPAAKAGVRPGDVILRIDDVAVQSMDGAEAVRRLRGLAGTTVRVQLLRESADAPFTVEMERAAIELASVRGRLFDQRFAYMRLSVFNDNTGEETRRELQRLAADADGEKISGIVLDLRSNPGGVLDAAVAVADLFLEDGLIVRAAGRVPGARYERSATAGDIAGGMPIVVLIDSGSASGSEILAGALQDHRRAVVMGEQSFGKGSLQSVIPLSARSGMKLTTARYYTPAGRSIQAEGIVPDIVVTPLQMTAATPRPGLRESDLDRHLRNAESGPRGTPPAETLALQDYPLNEALNLLRGLRIMHDAGRP